MLIDSEWHQLGHGQDQGPKRWGGPLGQSLCFKLTFLVGKSESSVKERDVLIVIIFSLNMEYLPNKFNLILVFASHWGYSNIWLKYSQAVK